MRISQSKDKEPTPEELQELEKLKGIIERIIADGKLTGIEFERIKAVIRADQKVSFEELQLVRKQGYFMLVPMHQEINFLAKISSPFKRT